MKNWIWITLESIRYDMFKDTYTPNMDSIGECHKAFSIADWTLPSVMSMMTGILPHSELGQHIREMFIKNNVIVNEGFWIPSSFSNMGYNTYANVSVIWLNMINRGWNDFHMEEGYENSKNIIEYSKKMVEPFFFYAHIGDTHMPYGGNLIEKETIDRYNSGENIINYERMLALKKAQSEALKRVDKNIGELLESTKTGTKIIITSDHGELFGEDHKFGHGCHFHRKVFEVPLIMGEIQ